MSDVPVAQRRADRAAAHRRRWAARYARAATPSQRAAVDWDRLRAALADLAKQDPAAAERAWLSVASLLSDAADRYQPAPRRSRRR